MTPQMQPYREPLRTTLVRTGLIALIVGALLARRWGGLTRWPLATLLVLWPSFGGHWVELAYLNHLLLASPTHPPCAPEPALPSGSLEASCYSWAWN